MSKDRLSLSLPWLWLIARQPLARGAAAAAPLVVLFVLLSPGQARFPTVPTSAAAGWFAAVLIADLLLPNNALRRDILGTRADHGLLALPFTGRTLWMAHAAGLLLWLLVPIGSSVASSFAFGIKGETAWLAGLRMASGAVLFVAGTGVLVPRLSRIEVTARRALWVLLTLAAAVTVGASSNAVVHALSLLISGCLFTYGWVAAGPSLMLEGRPENPEAKPPATDPPRRARPARRRPQWFFARPEVRLCSLAPSLSLVFFMLCIWEWSSSGGELSSLAAGLFAAWFLVDRAAAIALQVHHLPVRGRTVVFALMLLLVPNAILAFGTGYIFRTLLSKIGFEI